jgi:pentapeptide MXKDX repeat protein
MQSHSARREAAMRTMTGSGRSGLVALAVGVSLASVPGAWAQSDTMKKDEMMTKGEMKDGMAKDGMMKDDGMKGADKAMTKDGMMRDDAMKKGEIKGDAMEKKQ